MNYSLRVVVSPPTTDKYGNYFFIKVGFGLAVKLSASLRPMYVCTYICMLYATRLTSKINRGKKCENKNNRSRTRSIDSRAPSDTTPISCGTNTLSAKWMATTTVTQTLPPTYTQVFILEHGYYAQCDLLSLQHLFLLNLTSNERTRGHVSNHEFRARVWTLNVLTIRT